MARQRSSNTVRCNFFTWNVFKRGSIYYADGRSGATKLGKHSLAVKTEDEALENLRLLDEKMARKAGLIPDEPKAHVTADASSQIGIADGWAKFLEHCDRPVVMGGVSRNTLKRYRAVRDKHVEFCRQRLIGEWSRFGNQQTEQYGRWLDDNEYASRSIYLEMTLIVSVVKWLIDQKLLDAQYRIQTVLTKPSGTDTYCYNRQQMSRMLEFCQSSEPGRWIRPILVALATTGMRIGELIALRWSDIDFKAESIRIADERFSGRKEIRGRNRTTKGKRSRSVPLNPALQLVLRELERNPDGYGVGHRSSQMVHHYRHLRPDDSQRRMQSINFISDDTVSPGNQPEPDVPQESNAG